VLEAVSLVVPAGRTLALVGHTGCGKTTLTNLIPRFYDVSAGRVLVDGQDVRELQAADLRGHIGIVTQDPFLFSASIAENIRFGRPDATDEEVKAAARAAQADDFVAALPESYDTVVGERGFTLSGGQRQRIAIARALATEPRVIVADEAVSSLDVSIRATVLNLMMELQKDMNLSYIFISHDMAVVERVSHRVAVMYLGQIVEMGRRSDIFENPQHPYTRKLLAAIPVADPALRTSFSMLTGEIPSPVRKVGDPPPPLRYEEAAPGHMVAV
jgi:glutathione transport system ATP-binding protein